jgi:hypothetical protein
MTDVDIYIIHAEEEEAFSFKTHWEHASYASHLHKVGAQKPEQLRL